MQIFESHELILYETFSLVSRHSRAEEGDPKTKHPKPGPGHRRSRECGNPNNRLAYAGFPHSRERRAVNFKVDR